jgi:hypothetical protein
VDGALLRGINCHADDARCDLSSEQLDVHRAATKTLREVT